MPRISRWFAAFLALWTFLSGSAAFLEAAPTALQRRQAAYINSGIRKTELLYNNGKVEDAAKGVKLLVGYIEKFKDGAKDEDTLDLIRGSMKKLGEVRSLLALDGVELPEVPELAIDAPPSDDPPPAQPGMRVSFTKEVAPILVGKCGKCHIQDSKGRFNMSTFANLARGTADAGRVIFPGDGESSRLVEVIASGDMPRGGAKISKEELELITKWIDEGANYDGPQGNFNVPLTALAKVDEPAKTPPPKVMAATGNETVSFSADLASVLNEHCMGCHGADNPRADFSVATFDRMFRGGDSGAVVVPGKPAESLLIKKLKGQAGQRMPLEQPALPADTIAKFETWISEGAKFDGSDPKMMTSRLAAVAMAANSTPEELSRKRKEQAAQTWQLAIPDISASTVETDDFLIVGNLGTGELEEIGEIARRQKGEVLSALKVRGNQPLTKGKLTIFVFAQRFDYTELGTMVEKRQYPRSWHGHWNYEIVNPYIAIVPPRSDEYDLDNFVAQLLASTYVAAQGNGVPRWLAEGAGRAVAAKLDRNNPRVEAWENQLSGALARTRSAEAFIEGKIAPSEADVLSFAFVQKLMSSSRRFGTLLSALNEGATIDQAMVAAYGGTPVQIAQGWLAQARR